MTKFRMDPAVTLPMVGLSAVVAMGGLYLVGGDMFAAATRKCLFRYNATSNGWTQLANMKAVHNCFSAKVHHRDHIYVIGGGLPERYNLNTDQWETLPRPPKYCRTSSAVVYNDRILVLGRNDHDNQTHLMLFHPETKQWDLLLSEDTPSRMVMIVLVVHEQHCYCVSTKNGILSTQLIRMTTNNGVTEATLEPKKTADGCSIFCIDDSKYVRLHDYYVFKVKTEYTDPNTGDVFADLKCPINKNAVSHACFLEMPLDVYKLT